jgi:phosphoglycolate phosphatase-like HAD superfamily hydrolase
MVQHMKTTAVSFTALLAILACQPKQAADPLPSWNDGPVKAAIVDFVDRVTDPAHTDYRDPEERVAVFDNDGTLWAEQPVYFQLIFALDRVRALAPEHPEWTDTDPFRAVIANDQAAMASFDMPELMAIIGATHSGMTTTDFRATSRVWLDSARHPRFDRLYRELTYQPMMELLDYLRANDFQVWIVSGGGIEFLRSIAEDAYGVPPEQVVGSSTQAEYRDDEGDPRIMKLPKLGSINDKGGKPVNINLHIGRRPILAFGNSDGDFQMLEYTTTGDGARLGLLLHHDDAGREYAYDRESHVGRLDRGLDEAEARGWVLVSMARDFGVMFDEQ